MKNGAWGQNSQVGAKLCKDEESLNTNKNQLCALRIKHTEILSLPPGEKADSSHCLVAAQAPTIFLPFQLTDRKSCASMVCTMHSQAVAALAFCTESREYPTELIFCASYEGSRQQSALPMKLQDPCLWNSLVLLTPYFTIG